MAEYNSVNLGRIMPKYTGDYSTNVNYNTLDIVFYEGSSYIATQPSLRQTPAIDSEYWGLISSKGDKGDKGDTGATGPKGDKGDPGKDAEMPVVGGRNLLLGTADWSGGSTRWDQRGTVTADTYRGTVIATTASPWKSPVYMVQNAGILQVGKTYTFSTYIRNTSDMDTIVGYYYDKAIVTNTGTITTLPAHTDWTRVFVTFKVLKDPTTSTQGLRWEGQNTLTNGQIQFAGYKLEAGNVATDWTPAPEDIDSNINTQINNLAIVGRNYLLNTANYSKNWMWDITPSIDGSQVPNILHYPKTTLSSGIKNIATQVISNGILQPSTTYTASFYAKGTGTAIFYCWPNVAVGHYDNRTNITLSSNFKRYTITFTTNSDLHGDKQLLIRQDYSATATNQNTVEAYIYGLKLEKGNVATDWTPAIEDVPSNDAQLVHKTGNETVAGDKTFTGNTSLASTTILAGNYGLRVTPSGFQKTTDGKTWVSANI